MEKQQRYDSLYLDLALRVAQMSQAKRLQVGCVLIKNDSIISFGWNGMPTGWNNNCEIWNDSLELVTKPEVLHAESNCLMKVAKSTESSVNSTLYLTHSPCIHCAKMVYQAGIIRLVYLNKYRSDDGLNFLQQCSIQVEKFNYDNHITTRKFD
jgi:dCMP deaminase